MFHINSKQDKPDINYMLHRAIELMQRGIKLGDVESLYSKFSQAQKEIGEGIRKEYGIANPNSAPQIIKYMQAQDNMEIYEVCCIEGKWSSKGEYLSNLALLGYQFAREILEYRKAKKYAESIWSMMSARELDGMVHPEVSLGKTNRLNYINPALMNIPKALLWNIVAPRKEGNILFSADIKNQEPSILINLLGIEELKDALLDPRGLYETLFTKPFTQKTKLTVYVTEKEERRIVPAKEMAETNIPPVYYTPVRPSVFSVYCRGEQVKLIEVCNTVTNIGVMPLLPETIAIETVTGAVYKVPVVWEEIKDKQLTKQGMIEITGIIQELDIRCEGIARKEFKQSWNAMTYGAGNFGIKKMCKHIDGDDIYKYFSKIPEFKAYKSNCTKMAERKIQHINTLFGSPLFANEPDTGKLQRVLMDLPIQGTAADILSMLIKHFDEEVKYRGLKDKLEIYYTRHDELILEADGNWVATIGKQAVIEVIRDIVEHQIDNWIPFKLEIKAVQSEQLSIENATEEDMFEA